MKIRDLLLKVEPDHQFTLQRMDANALADEHLFQILILKCSCKWKTRRAVNLNEIDEGYSTIITQEWMWRKQMEHLLDQEVSE